MRWIWMMAAVMLALAGCANYTPIGNRSVDSSYRHIGGPLRFTHGEARISVFVKIFETDKMLGLCGSYYVDGSGLQKSAMEGAFASADSALYLGKSKVSTLAFMREEYTKSYPGDEMAYCIRTNTPWDPAYSTAPIYVQWGSGRAMI